MITAEHNKLNPWPQVSQFTAYRPAALPQVKEEPVHNYGESAPASTGGGPAVKGWIVKLRCGISKPKLSPTASHTARDSGEPAKLLDDHSRAESRQFRHSPTKVAAKRGKHPLVVKQEAGTGSDAAGGFRQASRTSARKRQPSAKLQAGHTDAAASAGSAGTAVARPSMHRAGESSRKRVLPLKLAGLITVPSAGRQDSAAPTAQAAKRQRVGPAAGEGPAEEAVSISRSGRRQKPTLRALGGLGLVLSGSKAGKRHQLPRSKPELCTHAPLPAVKLEPELTAQVCITKPSVLRKFARTWLVSNVQMYLMKVLPRLVIDIALTAQGLHCRRMLM